MEHNMILALTLFLFGLVHPTVANTSWPPMDDGRVVNKQSTAVDSGQWCPPECDCFNYFETVDCSRRGTDLLIKYTLSKNVTKVLFTYYIITLQNVTLNYFIN